MLVRDAKAVARRWVVEEASRSPDFHGAYFAGSVNWLPDDSILPSTSDLDINVVCSDPNGRRARGKWVYRDVLLEATYLSLERLRSPEAILGDYHLAGGFRKPSIMLDPSGRLTELQTAVSRDYARHRWVRRRCEHARQAVLDGLAGVDESAPLSDQVIGWLFATGRTTHILLVAGLQNPTVRRRYVVVRDLLARYGHPAFHETLLELLGCAQTSRTQVEEHLVALTDVFDVATTVVKTPFPFASDISDIARPLAIEGSRELIAQGFHREAMFWIAVTYSRCQKVLAFDETAGLKRPYDPGYPRLLGDLGITSFADLRRRSELTADHLAQVWEVAENIMSNNPGIER